MNSQDLIVCSCIACGSGAQLLRYEGIFKLMLTLMILLIILDIYHIWRRCNRRKSRSIELNRAKGVQHGKTGA